MAVPNYWMVSNRAVHGGEFSQEQGPLKYFVSDQGPLDNFSNWQNVSADAFKKLLVGAADQFPALAHGENEKQSHVTFFIHCYNNGWDDAARRYQKLCNDLYSGQNSLGICISFDWPSLGSVLGYLPDRDHARDCAGDLVDVLSQLYDWLLVKQQATADDPTDACKAKISVISHSMGNYVIQKAMSDVWIRKHKPQFGLLNQLVMVAADVDNDLFERGAHDCADGDAITNLSHRVTVLYSGRDAVLGASAGIRKFHVQRLGRAGLAVRPPSDKDNVVDVDCSSFFPSGMGADGIHGAYFGTGRTLTLIRDILRGIELTSDYQQGQQVHHHHYEAGAKAEFMNTKTTNITVNTNYGQIGETLTNCTSIIKQQSDSEAKRLLEKLQADVTAMIQAFPTEQTKLGEKTSKNLQRLIEVATEKEPEREWYSVSAKGVLEASKFAKEFTGNIAGTIGQLGKLLWPNFKLSEVKKE
jgi:esterase/lipase superfamily enzyme